MKNKFIKNVAISLIGVMTLGLTGCGEAATYDGYVFPDQPESSLEAVSDTYVENPIQFEDAGTIDKETAAFSSDNGACVIKKMEHYYDVTLDYENHTPEEIGKALAEEMAEKACGARGFIAGFKRLTPEDVIKIYRMCL